MCCVSKTHLAAEYAVTGQDPDQPKEKLMEEYPSFFTTGLLAAEKQHDLHLPHQTDTAPGFFAGGWSASEYLYGYAI